MRRWLRALRDRFGRAEVPQGWTPEAFDEIRPHFTDPWDLEDTAVVIVVDPHLGPLDVIEPVRPLLFDKVRDVYPVDLSWRPGWLDGLVTA